MTIVLEDLQRDDIRQLLALHLAECHEFSSPESCHVLALDSLRHEDISLWSLRDEISGELLGCGALKDLGDGTGEIKSMRTAPHHLRKGVGSSLLQHIIDEARQRHLRALLLETGSMQEFDAARTLYLRFGFTPCPPFGNYVLDPESVYFRLDI